MTTAPIKDTRSLSDPIQFDRQRTDCTIENLEALVAGENGAKDAYANLTAEEKLFKQEELSFYSSSKDFSVRCFSIGPYLSSLFC